jgi:hypothetical protein
MTADKGDDRSAGGPNRTNTGFERRGILSQYLNARRFHIIFKQLNINRL